MRDNQRPPGARTAPCSTYNVAVVATMNSGKSTLLNAMLGSQLLPTRIRACTATVFRLLDVDGMEGFRFRARPAGSDWGDWHPVDPDSLERHNCGTYEEVEVHGDFPHIDNQLKGHAISFYDTPGPNNSGNADHEAVTRRILESADFNIVVCVLNAGQHGVSDERALLEFLRTTLDARPQGCDVCFALNQFDRLDPENGEDPLKTVHHTTAYLEEVGFVNPVVIPTMGRLSLHMRRCFRSLDPQGRSSLPERSLNHLAREVELMRHFYNVHMETLLRSDSFDYYWQRAIRQHRHYKDIPGIQLAGQDFPMETLINYEIATGVPFLEEYLETRLLRHARNAVATEKNVGRQPQSKKDTHRPHGPPNVIALRGPHRYPATACPLHWQRKKP